MLPLFVCAPLGHNNGMTVQLLDVPEGHIAAVVTCLEMTERPKPKPLPVMMSARLMPVAEPDPASYRRLFRAVGAPWLWFGRLMMEDDALAALLHDPDILLYTVRQGPEEVGMVDLDCRADGEVEISYFGVLPNLAGRGLGGWLMAQTLQIAWGRRPRRVWVRTCTLDHPGALGFYIHHGFRPYARKVEIVPDPRLAGLLPRDAAPQVPLLGDLA